MLSETLAAGVPLAERIADRARDKAVAMLAESRAEAAVIAFENEADAAGRKKSVEALGSDGQAFARYVLYQKLAPGFRSIMTNTADSPLMAVFQNFAQGDEPLKAEDEGPLKTADNPSADDSNL